MPLVGSVRKKIDDAKRDPKYYAYTGRDVNVNRDFRKPRT